MDTIVERLKVQETIDSDELNALLAGSSAPSDRQVASGTLG
jgi:hypothetical protein